MSTADSGNASELQADFQDACISLLISSHRYCVGVILRNVLVSRHGTIMVSTKKTLTFAGWTECQTSKFF